MSARTGEVLMRFCSDQARELLSRVDPGRVHAGRAVGLRDGALLALLATGLTVRETAALRASALTTTSGQVQLAIQRQGLTWSVVLSPDLGAWLLAWLSECLCGEAEPVFRGPRGPLSPIAIRKVLERYRNRPPAPVRRRRQ